MNNGTERGRHGDDRRQALGDARAGTVLLVLDAQGLAAAGLGSVRHIRRLDASGRLPRSVRLGGKKKVWPVDELRAWLAAGAPHRDAWEQTKANT